MVVSVDDAPVRMMIHPVRLSWRYKSCWVGKVGCELPRATQAFIEAPAIAMMRQNQCWDIGCIRCAAIPLNWTPSRMVLERQYLLHISRM